MIFVDNRQCFAKHEPGLVGAHWTGGARLLLDFLTLLAVGGICPRHRELLLVVSEFIDALGDGLSALLDTSILAQELAAGRRRDASWSLLRNPPLGFTSLEPGQGARRQGRILKPRAWACFSAALKDGSTVFGIFTSTLVCRFCRHLRQTSGSKSRPLGY